MKFIRIGFVAVLLLLLVVPVGWAKGDKDLREPEGDCAVDVKVLQWPTDENGPFTWRFRVTEPGGACKDLSNWAVALPAEYTDSGDPVYPEVVDATPGYEVGLNPHTESYSIKWDVTDSFTSEEFSFTLEGKNLSDILFLEYAAKAGRTLDVDTIAPVDDSSPPNEAAGGG
jgi:hypothetical protein